MSTTDLAECSKCAALLTDSDDSIAKHRRWHTQQEDAAEAVRRVASAASTDVRTLTSTVKDYQRPPQPQAPAAVSIRVTDPDELEPDDTDHIIDLNAQQDDDIRFIPDNEEFENTTLQDGERASTFVYPSIDRPEEDDLDTRIANATGTQPTI